MACLKVKTNPISVKQMAEIGGGSNVSKCSVSIWTTVTLVLVLAVELAMSSMLGLALSVPAVNMSLETEVGTFTDLVDVGRAELILPTNDALYAVGALCAGETRCVEVALYAGVALCAEVVMSN